MIAGPFYYETNLEWEGARRARSSSGSLPLIHTSSPAELRGEAGHWSPDQLLSAALEASLMASFLAIADHFAFVPSAVMVRSEVAREVGGFDARFDGTEDLDFALKVAQGHRVGTLAACLTRYHLHEGQTGRRRLAGGNARVLRHHLERQTDAPLRDEMRRKLARYLVSSAKRADNPKERRQLLDEAAEVDSRVRFRAAWLRQRFGFGSTAS